MATTIVPTILTNSIQTFIQFFNVYKSFANRIQLDVCDGEFVSITTVQIDEISSSVTWDGKWDLHMMVSRPSRFIPAILKMKPSLVIFHAEAKENLLPVFEQLSANGIKTGVAFKKETFPGSWRQYIDAADHALIFAGDIGHQGGEADLLQLEKAQIIRSIDENIEIGWDGGANLENIRTIAHSGITVINVGKAISSADNAAEAYHSLEVESEKQGVNV